ncbi:hypothetical protein BAC1_02487 [uncultured bacterium]|nr:hypothetical protein BAC1_02487 [uncultured bacterium]
MHKEGFSAKTLAAMAVLAVAALAVIYPIFGQWGNIGLSDWDNQLFYHGASVRTIKEFGQFPLWNPYHCGGVPMLASPEISFLSPTFIFDLVFGEVAGVKLMVVFYAVLGMWGMYFLSRTLGFGRVASFVPPAVYMASSWFTLRVTEGHTGFLPFVFLPFITAYFLRSLDSPGWQKALRPIAAASFFLAWSIFAGGVYPFIGISIFLSGLCLLSMISRWSLRPAASLIIIIVFTFLLSAVKSVPQYEFIKSFPRKTEALQHHSAPILKDALFSRNQMVTQQAAIFYQGADEDPAEYGKAFWKGERPWGWQEYGAFVGVSTALLLLAGLIFLRKLWVWYLLAAFSLLLALGDFSPINVWSLVRRLPVLGSLHGPSRVTVLFVFSASVIAGFVASRLESMKKPVSGGAARALTGALAAVVFLELATVSVPVISEAFTSPAYNLKLEGEFRHLYVQNPTATNYPYFLKNVGVLNCYESQHPPTKAVPYGDDTGRKNPGYRGEAFLASGKGKAAVTYFSPNIVTVDVFAAGPDNLVLNQNYFKGWKANGIDAADHWGLVGVPVDAGKKQVTFKYSPSSFKAGLAVSIVSFVIIGWIAVRPCRKYPTF